MSNWDIRLLHVGTLMHSGLSLTWPAYMPPLENDSPIDFPMLAFLLKKEGRNVLVDSGIADKYIVDGKAWGGLPAVGGRDYLLAALDKEGVEPGDIDTVIYTHLHNDHAGSCELFQDARIIFQEDEWLNLIRPLPIQLWRRDYDLDVIPILEKMKPLMINGDFELEDGIRLFKTPGHTLGSQSVAVKTRKGVVVIIGDLVIRDYQLFPDIGEMTDMKGETRVIPKAPEYLGSSLPALLTYDFYAFYQSMQTVRAIASKNEPGYILPGHEPSLIYKGLS